MKLNLGAGYDTQPADEGWVNIDLDPDVPGITGDVRRLGLIGDEEVDEIRAVDILEHLSYRDTVPALQEWARVLKPGGRMFIQVPAADVMMDAWAEAWGADGDGMHVDLRKGVPNEFKNAPLIVCLAWRLLGGHYDGQYTRDSERWYLNAHHALFDEETIRWAAAQAGLEVESIEVNAHPNYLVWLVKP